MCSPQIPQENIWKRLIRICLAAAWLLVTISYCGCIHAAQVAEGEEVVSHAKMRPIDLDGSTAEKIGHEAQRKIGYDAIIRLAEIAGFVAYKTDASIQLTSYDLVAPTGLIRVFSRYAAAAGVTSQADSPLPGPADLAALGIVVIGLVDSGLLDGYLLNTVEEWLVGTRSKLSISHAKTDDEGSRGRAGNEGRGRGANRADGRMVDDAARRAGISDRAGFGKFIETEKRATGRGGADNFTWEELLELADQFKSHGGQ